jgi:ABC-type sugar transport system ATPase subunit
MSGPLVEMRGIRHRFGAIEALRGASLGVQPGEIHALVGENGSGKTTLMRILVGDLEPDGGELRIGGEAVRWSGPGQARQGIGLVFQEPNLAPDLTVAENVLMGRLPRRRSRIDRREVVRQVEAISRATEIRLEPRRYVRDLSPDQRQLVEIAKVVATHPRVIALDEPTASLTEDQVEILFRLLRRLRGRGNSVVFISHRLREVFALCDRVTVLRDGETRSTLDVRQTGEDEIIRLMVGRELGETIRTVGEPGAPGLEVRNLSRGTALRDISLTVRSGEIVGLAGLVGAGRSALARTLFGLRHADAGEILVRGRPVRIRQPSDAIAAGLGLVPEDRREAGLCLDLSIRENVALGHYARRRLASVLSLADDRRRADELIRSLSIRAPGAETLVRTLSGGNQQKVVLARWLSLDPTVLVLDEPTRGIDVGAKAEIYHLLDRLAVQGVAQLVISSELPELLTLCDRIYAMYNGALVAEFTRANATEEAVARAISGTLA